MPSQQTFGGTGPPAGAASGMMGGPSTPGGATNLSLSGVGYYMLQPGTQLLAHAGPTNQRLTCHLTLNASSVVGEEGQSDEGSTAGYYTGGAWFTVGASQRVEWVVGKAMCFDDSFVHEAVHQGAAPRYVLLLDVPHPDLATLPTEGPY